MLCSSAKVWLAGHAELERTGPFGTPSFPWLWEHERRVEGRQERACGSALCERPERPTHA